MRYKKNKIGTIVIHIAMIIGGLFWIYPYAWLIASSFKPSQQIYTTGLFNIDFTLENYNFLFDSSAKLHRPFVKAFFNSLVVSLSVTSIVVVTTSFISYGLAKIKFYGREAVNGFILFQMVFPAFMFIIPLFILIKKMGLIDSYSALILPNIMSGWAIFMLVQSYKSTPGEYIEAAIIDGAGIFWIIGKIMVPLNKAILSIIALNTFVGIWDNFMWPLIVMKSFDKMPLSVLLAIFSKEFGQQYVGPVMAGAVIQTLPMVILFILFRKHFLNGISVSLK